MIFLLFQIGRERYALDVREVVEVLPLLALKEVPQAPVGVAGLFDYRGRPVPAIDLAQLALGRAAEQRLGTRILLVNIVLDGERRLLGLIAERATDTLRREEKDFVASGVHAADAPYLGPVCSDERGLIQRVLVERLLPATVRAALQAADAAP